MIIFDGHGFVRTRRDDTDYGDGEISHGDGGGNGAGYGSSTVEHFITGGGTFCEPRHFGDFCTTVDVLATTFRGGGMITWSLVRCLD